MNYKIGDKVKATNYFNDNVVEGVVENIEGHYAIYIRTEKEVIKLEKRHWKVEALKQAELIGRSRQCGHSLISSKLLLSKCEQMDEFIKIANKLIENAKKKQLAAQKAIDEVSRFVQTKYPEVIAEYMPSDGGITFIGLEDTEQEAMEFYGVENLINFLGKR